MLRLATPGFLRLNHVLRPRDNLGGGEANVAVSLAHPREEPRLSRACRRMTWRKPAFNACADWGLIPSTSCAVATASASTSSRPALRNAPPPSPTTARIARFPRLSRLTSRRKFSSGRRLVSLHGDHARVVRCGGAGIAGRRPRGEEARTDRELRPQLPQKTLDERKGRTGHGPDHGVRRHLHCERRRCGKRPRD